MTNEEKLLIACRNKLQDYCYSHETCMGCIFFKEMKFAGEGFRHCELMSIAEFIKDNNYKLALDLGDNDEQ